MHSVELDSSVPTKWRSHTGEPNQAQCCEEQETEVTTQKMTPQKQKELKTAELREESRSEEE